jgi:hypothetical protein
VPVDRQSPTFRRSPLGVTDALMQTIPGQQLSRFTNAFNINDLNSQSTDFSKSRAAVRPDSLPAVAHCESVGDDPALALRSLVSCCLKLGGEAMSSLEVGFSRGRRLKIPEKTEVAWIHGNITTKSYDAVGRLQTVKDALSPVAYCRSARPRTTATMRWGACSQRQTLIATQPHLIMTA